MIVMLLSKEMRSESGFAFRKLDSNRSEPEKAAINCGFLELVTFFSDEFKFEFKFNLLITRKEISRMTVILSDSPTNYK